MERIAEQERVQCDCGKVFRMSSSISHNPCCAGREFKEAPPLPAIKPLGRKKRNRKMGKQVSDLLGAHSV